MLDDLDVNAPTLGVTSGALHAPARWDLRTVDYGAPARDLGAAMGDVIELDDAGVVRALHFLVPDRRMPFESALAQLAGRRVDALISCKGLRRLSPRLGRYSSCMAEALIVSSDATLLTEAVNVALGNGLELTLSGNRLVGWILRNPFQYLAPGTTRAEVVEAYWTMQLRDDELGDALTNWPVGFRELVDEMAGARVALSPDIAERCVATQERVLGRAP